MIKILNKFFYKKKITNDLVKHNQKFFYQDQNYKNKILIELSFLPSSIIAYSYFIKVLSNFYKAKPIAYLSIINSGYLNFMKIKIKQILKIDYFKIYDSLNVKKYFFLYNTKNYNLEIKKNYEKILKSIKSKKNLEKLKIDNILIGDLIYDSFLKKYRKPTIRLDSQEFKFFLYQSVKNFVIWKNYLDDNKFKAIVVSHTVYDLAIPLRICVKKNIDVFQLNDNSIYKMSKTNLFAYQTAFESYPKIFNSFSKIKKKKALNLSKKRTALRFDGKVGIDMTYSKISAYSKEYKKRFLKKSNKLKILVPTHCFFDSPHSYGYNLFPDFYEWINFLGKISEKTDYEWYIKTHPDYLPGTIEIIKKFLVKYPKFKLLPSNLSHHQIIREGINIALTVHGTIGFEYAYLGIPVINASNNNPHKAYKFNAHMKNLKQYENLLMNLRKRNLLHIKLNKDKILEFYYMHYLNFKDSWLNKDYNGTINFCGGYKNLSTYKYYEYWLKNFNKNEHLSILKDLKNFVIKRKIFYRKESNLL